MLPYPCVHVTLHNVYLCDPHRGNAVSPIVQRFLHQPMPVYDQLVSAFVGNDLDKLGLQLSSSTDREVLSRDGNLGLAKQLLPMLIRTRICTLARSYMTLSLHDIASTVGLASVSSEAAECTMLSLLSAGELSGKIDQQSGMVHFSDATGTGAGTGLRDTQDVLVQLQQNMAVSVQLSEELGRLQRIMLSSPEYISRAVAPSHGGTGVGAAWFAADDDVMDVSTMSRYV